MKIEPVREGNVIIELDDGTRMELHTTSSKLMIVGLEFDKFDIYEDATNVVTLRKSKNEDVK